MDNHQPSLTSAEIALSGPSNLPDPAFHAYRRDLADRSVANRVISSHYADPLGVTVRNTAWFRAGPSGESEALGELQAGDTFELLDSKLGWAWGYAGPNRRVGYVEAQALGLE
ncbi:MAG: SH3 domain-containing protein [Sphingomicrobium sp.]